MGQKKQRVTASIHPITTEEVALIRERVGVALRDNGALAARFDAFMSSWDAVQKASAAKDLRLSQLRRSLLLAMGVLPSSEKQKPSESKAPGSRKGAKPRSIEEKIENDLLKALTRSQYYKKLIRRLVRRLKRARAKSNERAQGNQVDINNQGHEKYDPNELANEPLTAEEEAEDKAEEEDRERCMKLGDGLDPKFGLASAQLIARGISAAVVSEADVVIRDDKMPAGAINVSSFVETRRRYDCRMQVTAIDLSVEKRVIITNGEKQVITADLSDIGPAKMKVTWGFLAQISVLATQYALPFNRLALMLSTQEKVFRSAEICRYFAYVAERLLPIYLYFAKQLANLAYLSGDDTDALVLEIVRGHALVQKKIDPPWHIYKTMDHATEELERLKKTEKPPSLALQTAAVLGFESMRVDGKGPIIDFKTTLIKGRSDEDDPASLIVFYRSHLGGFGNLLDAILQSRNVKAPRQLHLQTDLSRVNLALSPEVKKHIKITLYGCLSHVRRPFKRYRDENPMFCDVVLASIAQVFLNEQMLSLHGRNAENIIAVRQRHSLPHLELVEEMCDMIKELYPSAHPLGKGARYFLNHPKELRAFINNPMIAPSNDESEQMVRMESLVASNSYFRQSIEGRVQFDICRTVGQTAISAGCQSSDYFEWVLRKDPQHIEANPAAYTPLAYRQELAGETSNQASIIPFPQNLHGPPTRK